MPVRLEEEELTPLQYQIAPDAQLLTGCWHESRQQVRAAQKQPEWKPLR